MRGKVLPVFCERQMEGLSHHPILLESTAERFLVASHNEKTIIKSGAKEIEYGGQRLNLQDPMPPNFY